MGDRCDCKRTVVMIIFLDEACERRRREGRLRSIANLREANLEGAVQRVRPKLMAASAIFVGLLPIMWSHGTGAIVRQRIAAPMIGGMVSSILLTLVVIPAVCMMWRGGNWNRVPVAWPGAQERRMTCWPGMQGFVGSPAG